MNFSQLFFLITMICFSIQAMEQAEPNAKHRKIEHIQHASDASSCVKRLVKLSANAAVDTTKSPNNSGYVAGLIHRNDAQGIVGRVETLPNDLIIMMLKKIINEIVFTKKTDGHSLNEMIINGFNERLSQEDINELHEYADTREQLFLRYTRLKTQFDQFIRDAEYEESHTESRKPTCLMRLFCSTDLLSHIKGSRYIKAFGELFNQVSRSPHTKVNPENCSECYGILPIHLLALSGNVKFTTWMFKNAQSPININARCLQEHTPLEFCLDQQATMDTGPQGVKRVINAEMVKLLVEKGADYTDRLTYEAPLTPLAFAQLTYCPSQKEITELKKIIDFLKSQPGTHDDHGALEWLLRAEGTTLGTLDSDVHENYPLVGYSYPDGSYREIFEKLQRFSESDDEAGMEFEFTL